MFQVVVADGRILQVNPESHPDLYWALRGGGNNFGIVTRLDLAAYPGGALWGGTRVYSMSDSNKDALLNAVTKLAQDAHSDPKAALVLQIAHLENKLVAFAELQYTEPVANPPVFQRFREIPSVADTMGIKPLPQVVRELGVGVDGARKAWWTATIKPDIQTVTSAVDIFNSGVERIKQVKGVIPVIMLQPLSSTTMEMTNKDGGNALGLDASEGPLLVILLSAVWSDGADDALVQDAMNDIIGGISDDAQRRGTFNRFKYMNYASEFQTVVPSYGDQNRERLVEIADQYDPHGVFQRLQPGHFKLAGAPDPSLPDPSALL